MALQKNVENILDGHGYQYEEVYWRMNIKQSLLVDIVRRQMSFLGHVLRKEEMEHLVVTGFVDGKRACG